MYYERYEDSPQDDPENVVTDDFVTDFSKDLLVLKLSKQFTAASINHDRREFGKNDPYFIEQERVNVNEPLHTFVLVESNTPSTPLPKATQVMQGRFRTSEFIVERSLSPSLANSRHSEEAPEFKDTISVQFRKSEKGNSKSGGSSPTTVSFSSDEIGDEASGEGEDSNQLKLMETGAANKKAKY